MEFEKIKKFKKILDFISAMWYYTMAVLKSACALIAQLDRASGYGPEGREFESSSARQNRKPAVKRVFLCLCGLAGCLYSISMYANIVKILK